MTFKHKNVFVSVVEGGTWTPIKDGRARLLLTNSSLFEKCFRLFAKNSLFWFLCYSLLSSLTTNSQRHNLAGMATLGTKISEASSCSAKTAAVDRNVWTCTIYQISNTHFNVLKWCHNWLISLVYKKLNKYVNTYKLFDFFTYLQPKFVLAQLYYNQLEKQCPKFS